MALKIRLRQQGRKNRAFYRLVVTDTRSPRDGKYVEALGWYNPIEAEDDKKLAIKADRIQHWLNVGAQLTDNAENLIRKSAPHIIKDVDTEEAGAQGKSCNEAQRQARKLQA